MLRSSSHLQLMAGGRTAPPRPANWGPSNLAQAGPPHSLQPPRHWAGTQGALDTSALNLTTLQWTLQHYS